METAAGRMKKPMLYQICEWMVSVKGTILEKLVVQSFKKCCILNASDCSEYLISSDILTEITFLRNRKLWSKFVSIGKKFHILFLHLCCLK